MNGWLRKFSVHPGQQLVGGWKSWELSSGHPALRRPPLLTRGRRGGQPGSWGCGESQEEGCWPWRWKGGELGLGFPEPPHLVPSLSGAGGAGWKVPVSAWEGPWGNEAGEGTQPSA